MVAAVSGRKHFQPGLVSIISTGGDNFDRNGVIRAGKCIILVDLAVKPKSVPVAQIRIAVFIRMIVFVKDQRGKLPVHLGILDLTLCDRTVDFLLFVGQENIVVAKVLHQLLLNQLFQSRFHAVFQAVAVLVHLGCHQRSDILYRGCLELLHILDHEQDLEHFHLKADLCMVRVQEVIALCICDSDGCLMVHQSGQSLIKRIKRNQNAFILILDAFGSAQVHTQHRTLAVGTVLAGAAEQTNCIQNLAEQVELVRHKGVYLCKIRRIFVQFHFWHITSKLENGAERIHLMRIDSFQFCLRCFILFQDTLFDDLCHIAGGQGQPGVKASLNLGEVHIVNDLNFVNSLLCRDQHPCLTMALNSQIVLQRLEVQHHAGIIANVLTDLIHAENHMVVVALTLDMLADKLCEIFRADAVFFTHTVTPTSGSFFAHNVLLDHCLYKRILCKVNASHRIIPTAAFQLFDALPEFVKLALGIQLAFQICHAGILVGIAQLFIKRPQENHRDHITLGGAAGAALRSNIEQDHICTYALCRTNIRQNLGIGDLVVLDKVFQRRLSFHLLIADQIGEHLQEVRFTTSKETRDPDADPICIRTDTPTIIGEKCRKMLLQFLRHNIFLKFQFNGCFIHLTGFDHRFDLAIDGLRKHLTNIHVSSSYTSCSDRLCTIVVAILDIPKQVQITIFVPSGEHHKHNTICKPIMQIIQNFVGPQQGIALSNTGQQNNSILLWDTIHNIIQHKVIRLTDV